MKPLEAVSREHRVGQFALKIIATDGTPSSLNAKQHVTRHQRRVFSAIRLLHFDFLGKALDR